MRNVSTVIYNFTNGKRVFRRSDVGNTARIRAVQLFAKYQRRIVGEHIPSLCKRRAVVNVRIAMRNDRNRTRQYFQNTAFGIGNRIVCRYVVFRGIENFYRKRVLYATHVRDLRTADNFYSMS